jgi:lysozyme
MGMKTSDNGLTFIAREEGEVLHTYRDSGGCLTIGVGHLLRPGESYPNGITHDQAMDLLKQDVSVAENAVNNDVKVQITQQMFDALCIFSFNLGTGALASSTLLKLLNQGDFAGASAQFQVWDKVAGVHNPAIHARRLREAALFLTSDPSGGPDGTNVEPSDPAAGTSDPANS